MSETGSIFSPLPESQEWGLFCASSYQCEQTTICCKKEQVIAELISSLRFIEQIITIFGFKAQWILVIGRVKSPKNRQEREAIEWLKHAFQESGCCIPLVPDLCEELEGETPRLELRISDAIGRGWAVSTIRVLTGAGAENVQDARVVFTRSVFGSVERFVGLLLEHYEGNLPFWLVPEQVRVFAVGEANGDYALAVGQRLKHEGLRVKVDLRQSKLGGRIHEAELENIPYLLIVGEQERLKHKINVREAGKSNDNHLVDLETFVTNVSKSRTV